MGFPGGSDCKESACNEGDLDSVPGLGKSPREGQGYLLQYSGLENSMDRGAWQSTVHGVTKHRTLLSRFHFSLLSWASLVAQTVKNLPIIQETRIQSLGQEHPLEKGMATYSSILAWRIPWTEEPGSLQSIGSQRVKHD